MTRQDILDYIDSLGRLPGEYTEEERLEACRMAKDELDPKDKEGIWGVLAEKLGVNPGNSYKKGEALRCWYKSKLVKSGALPRSVRMLNGKVIGSDDKSIVELVAEQKRDLYMAQTLARDAMNEYRDDLRKDARARWLVESMKECASKKEPLYIPQGSIDQKKAEGGKEAVLLLSDMHIGMCIDSFCNKYDAEIAKERMKRLVSEVGYHCMLHKVSTLHVLDLGDEIHGLIHNSARLSQEYDAAEQVMVASELIAEALNALTAYVRVTYRGCLDNHARMMANYKDSKDTENFGRLIHFYLKSRLALNKKVSFPEDNLDPSLGMLTLSNGETMLFAHGHLDDPTKAVQEIYGIVMSMPNPPKRVRYFCLGHYHSEKMKQFQWLRVIVNSAFCGTDEYALSKRLISEPSQTLLIFDGDTLIENRIGLDIRA